MKQLHMTMLFFSCCYLQGITQMPAYEYVHFQKSDRKATVALPDFTVPLKRALREERAIYKEAPRLFVVSDIEGQYEQFKKLLWAAGVMDQQFNWTFGNGHLVVCGDVFDRGSQVTECLWLIYNLEEKAKRAGGYLHFILGNHELMNLNGDQRYLNPKYLEVARQNAVDYNSFYTDQTELGRWIRTKNIMEKIGDLLFLHGGASPYINQVEQPIDSINLLARSYYDKLNDSLPPIAQLLLLDYGPIWYRGYYLAPRATQQQVDSTLKLFRVKKIITGHTPVEQITAFYEGKVINVDVPHAKGASEGLLIENKKYYRVDLQGDKVLLIDN
ncbi:MAG: metallophosphoesterase [Bacteroidota bacterium]|nr:metallophosphoesterase [Flavisolibacter sp.]MDQ3842997.1 metallophosphoesterase [Bacteroidota bacterium]